MKKLLAIIVLGLLLSSNAYAQETYLICSHKEGGSITLSFNTEDNSGKEYVGGDSVIRYTAEISDESLLFQIEAGASGRSWTIDRYSGGAHLTDNGQSINWNCRKGAKKF
jgi:hypothetical protein